MKRKNTILLPISGDDPERNIRVTLTQPNGHLTPSRCHRGYYVGDLFLPGGASYHVEAIQLDKDENAINPTYQNRIDRYSESNEGLIPETVTLGRRTFFVNIEAYAQ